MARKGVGGHRRPAGDAKDDKQPDAQALGGMFQTVVERRPSPRVGNGVCGRSGCSPEAGMDEEEAVGAEAKGAGLTLGSPGVVGVF